MFVPCITGAKKITSVGMSGNRSCCKGTPHRECFQNSAAFHILYFSMLKNGWNTVFNSSFVVRTDNEIVFLCPLLPYKRSACQLKNIFSIEGRSVMKIRSHGARSCWPGTNGQNIVFKGMESLPILKLGAGSVKFKPRQDLCDIGGFTAQV